MTQIDKNSTFSLQNVRSKVSSSEMKMGGPKVLQKSSSSRFFNSPVRYRPS